jgi:hypothetical protein
MWQATAAKQRRKGHFNPNVILEESFFKAGKSYLPQIAGRLFRNDTPRVEH